jgi:hypothetical protein
MLVAKSLSIIGAGASMIIGTGGGGGGGCGGGGSAGGGDVSWMIIGGVPMSPCLFACCRSRWNAYT